MLYLDTHTILFLYMGDLNRFSKNGRALVQDQSLIISPMVCLELQYLFEVGKIVVKPEAILKTLKVEADLKICRLPLAEIITAAMPLTWTRDSFDRIIVANAMLDRNPLLTKDQTILDNYELAMW